MRRFWTLIMVLSGHLWRFCWTIQRISCSFGPIRCRNGRNCLERGMNQSFFFLNSISTYFQFVISETTTNNTQKMGRSPLKPPNQRNVVPRTQSSTQHAQLEKASEKSATSIIITTPSFWPRNWKKQIWWRLLFLTSKIQWLHRRTNPAQNTSQY